jgi:outer membrane protein OmpA-like peptidoglycan-associated protein
MTLSRSRAKKIFEFLKGKGISSSRMIIEAKGESAPKYDNNSSNKYKNRRVEFIKN